jgi:hypothetical protein
VLSLELNPLKSRIITEEVLEMGERLRQSGLLLINEMNTTCCYSVQDKVWVYDPDGNAWEIFHTKEDSEFESAPTTIEFTSFKKK